MQTIKCTLMKLNYLTKTMELDFDSEPPVDYLPYRTLVEGVMVVIYRPVAAYSPVMLQDVARGVVRDMAKV